MGDTALLAVVVAAIAVVVNAGVSIFLHFRRASFEKDLASKKFNYDVTLAERKAALDYQTANHQRKQTLAQEILTAFYEVQRIMPFIRSGEFWEGEGASRPSQDEEPPELQKTRDGYYVTIARINKNRKAIVRFTSKRYSAMALLGSDAGKTFEDFDQILNRIVGSANSLIRTAGNEKPPPSTMKWHADIWEGYGDAEDQVQIDLNRISGAVETLCKPILSARAPALSDISAQPSSGTAG